jgi:tRNA(Ile2) C34 agmatinyltransferase TiaS
LIYIGIDDTDTPFSRGTGRLARDIAARLSGMCEVAGITRHQLFVHPTIPYTSHNSSAVIHIRTHPGISPENLFPHVKEIMCNSFIEGSDPGLAVARSRDVSPGARDFGLSAKQKVVCQDEARRIAEQSGVILEGLGGTEDGVIGALAGIGLASSQNDGRYVLLGRLRDYRGEQTVETLLKAGIDRICTIDNLDVDSGTVRIAKFPKPSFRNGKAVLYVERENGGYRDLKVD